MSRINTINLICLASNDYKESVARLITRIGISISVIDSKSWIDGKFGNSIAPIILVLSEKKIIVDRILKTIVETPDSRYLAIFFSPVNNENNLILKACNDCIRWPCDPVELSIRLDRLMKRNISSASDKSIMKTVAWENFNLIGQSPPFLNTLTFIKKSSECNAPVLIEAETGCGKEVAARAIHYLGCRKDNPFIPVNCGAIPDHLFENELFGHEKGAYTDAKQSQAGLAEQADGGTLFLDEIETLSVKGQITLLRFIEDNVIKPLGAIKSRKVNVRIIAASNINLSELVAQGLFRQDLLFRLNLLHLNLPPLRNRKDDILLLAEHFLDKYRRQYELFDKQFHAEVIKWMIGYHWPGNVRELENFVHRSFLLSEDPKIIQIQKNDEVEQPPSHSRRKIFDRRQNFIFGGSFNEAKQNAISNFEQQYLTWLISSTKGNVSKAAQLAQKERRSIGKLLKKYHIDPFQYRNR
jgi:DNA-binding NtrC family response regulator